MQIQSHDQYFQKLQKGTADLTPLTCDPPLPPPPPVVTAKERAPTKFKGNSSVVNSWENMHDNTVDARLTESERGSSPTKAKDSLLIVNSGKNDLKVIRAHAKTDSNIRKDSIPLRGIPNDSLKVPGSMFRVSMQPKNLPWWDATMSEDEAPAIYSTDKIFQLNQMRYRQTIHGGLRLMTGQRKLTNEERSKV